MKRYYFMVRFLPEQANLALLTGRCISIMHGFIYKHKIEGLGVSFPAWSDVSIGNIIAFVHTDIGVLNELRQQGYFQDMQECGFFSIGNIEAVPDGCAEVRFKRNQNIAKIFVGETRRRLKRLEKRALARGEVFNPNKSTEPRDREAFHRIAMSSDTSQQDYLLHIQRCMANKRTEPMFNSYGFATNKQLNGTVPNLAHLVETI
ncbi:type I-F CRISPR-associated endoribonuclease Cas6/Csy4 [Shewanella schlegeliana]|uniref:Type I-F CRISPR-associated endoribonuclease Cas6/Csy4 n=1 Tax=Shewanella schlegeliana TaxID=190308 RepID=A0ABS1SVP8_9GAMM|nr:type I-F CRISPR-associated endoribonuclease Cas6/Csy4 [Shewanella schlegeliana]MBL4912592.1 type I-F CRISPR-associated endoribonuclease Cas6/Csy4 [Shewanella schlegeliana]MCL1109901.1 type I-F CRISPR-associated endoribonuclease Cas6/Csy4 [Shewanella schlegeliana]GIU32532.1 type I-F CRISPR-associated endoribonuclease Cas6/Csy4 [Shewanella schlegeliana]